MGTADFVRFVKISMLLSLLAFAIAAVLSPPDPFTQIVYVAVLLLAVPFFSYLLT